MGRKKASEKKDNYFYRTIYISNYKPLTFDVLNQKGLPIPELKNVEAKAQRRKDQIDEIIKIVKKSITPTVQKIIKPSFSLAEIDFSSSVEDNNDFFKLQ